MVSLPQLYRSVVISSYNDNLLRAILGLKIEDRPLLPPGHEEVVVHIEAAPCNPSDIAFLRGGYNIIKQLPAVPGFEGSGMVVACGSSPGAKALMGKRVSCFSQNLRDGTWAGYFITHYRNCIEIRDEMDMEQAACFAINPFTAKGLMEHALEKKSTAIVLNAAAGRVCDLIRVLAQRHGISVINLVRKSRNQRFLKDRGESYVLDVNSNEFETEFGKLIELHHPTTAFDAVAGEMTGLLLTALPPGSDVVVYGSLSGLPVTGINPMDLIFNNKRALGFNLSDWMASLDPGVLRRYSEELQEMVISGEMQTVISGRYPLDNVVGGIRAYIRDMSGGKVLLKPGM
ncbi:MAG: zinc-binding dehydrogenase [Bacteroidales bacterium]|nr:zinc-binding dehydrogenase [Bacteroidales bacterium]